MTKSDSDLKRGFRFRPLLTLVVLPALMTLVYLGVWQVQRLEWKNDLLVEISERLKSEPLPYNGSLANLPKYSPVQISGQFMAESTLYVTGRSHQGRTGVKVVTAFKADAGEVYWVDRGWSPGADHSLNRSHPVETIAITAMVKTYVPQTGLFVGGNDPSKGMWFLVDPQEMAKAIGLISGAEYLVLLAPVDDQIVPVVLSPTDGIRNSHFQYALIWFSLALILMIIYGLMSFQPGRPGSSRT
jgi:surfeit locus 1 family protein